MNVDKINRIMEMDERDLYGGFTRLLPLRKQRKLLKMLYEWGNSRYFEAIASKIESKTEAKVQCCIDMHNGYVVRNVKAYIEALCAYIRGHATLTEVMREYRYELNDGTIYGELIPAKFANNREQLMLIDLCGRLPYGVKCHADNFDEKVISPIGVKGQWVVQMMVRKPYYHLARYIKPYLRPMDSMTDAERKEWQELTYTGVRETDQYVAQSVIDWLNAHHFDYRDLIDNGLALEAPENMYNDRGKDYIDL